MNSFLSCDWGTTNFRLRWVDVDTLVVLAEHKSNKGILHAYDAWQNSDGEVSREDFFIDQINQEIDNLSNNLGINLIGVNVLISGMASSSLGIVHIPYKEAPFSVNGNNLITVKIQSKEHAYLLISGVQTCDDIMRGEETKIIGCSDYFQGEHRRKLLVLPGTHSKHVIINNDEMISFQTFMTGEFFDLLATKSILSSSIAKSNSFNEASFIAGVKDSKVQNLLHTSFTIRTKDLFGDQSKTENYDYLSGLLIGAELNSIAQNLPVYLVSGDTHRNLYHIALSELSIEPITIDADEALLKGQKMLLQRLSDH